MRKFLLLLLLCSYTLITESQTPPGLVQPGAADLNEYLPKLQGKKVGVFANQTSMVGDMHLVDLLMKKGVKVTVIFGPEHG